MKQNFVEAWGYDIQAAIYQAVEGNRLPFFIAAVTKETVPDKALLEIPQEVIDDPARDDRGVCAAVCGD